MPEIISLENIQNLHAVAKDFSTFLSHPDNADIAEDFPGTVRRYTGRLESVHAELVKTQEQCQEGVREQFIIYSGETAVGLSAIQLVDEPPEEIEANIPNLSGMIFNPWRTIGLGSASLQHRLTAVNERFGGKAYSLVRKANTASRKLVESNGLSVIGEDDVRLTYLYDKTTVRK